MQAILNLSTIWSRLRERRALGYWCKRQFFSKASLSAHQVSCYTLLHVPLVSRNCRLQWESCVNFRAGTVGFDNQIATKMAHALAHSSDSHSRALRLNLS